MAQIVIAMVVGFGCATAPTPTRSNAPRGSASRLAVRSFSETEPFVAVAELDGRLYAGTPDGLLAFEQRSGKLTRPYPKLKRITALAAHSAQGLWIATSSGLSRSKGGRLVPVTEGAPQPTTVLLADDDALWAGGENGLARLERGRWKTVLPGARISWLMPDDDPGTIWVGTRGQGIYSFTGGKLVAHDKTSGQVLRRVRAMAVDPTGGVVAVGHDAGKREVLVWYDGKHWTSYSAPSADALHWVVSVDGRLLVGRGQRVFELRRLRRTAAKTREAGQLELAATKSAAAPADYPVARFALRDVSWALPARATAVGAGGGAVLFGTRDLGLARFDGRKVAWFRTHSLVDPSHRLKLACTQSACYLAARGRGYRFDRSGHRQRIAVDNDPDSAVHAFTRDGQGRVIALHTPRGSERDLWVSRLADNGGFQRIMTARLSLPPSTRPRVRFARFGSDGRLWVGLSAVSPEKQARPWGVVVLSPGGKLMFHRSTLLPPEDRPPGSLALPDDVRDILFVDGTVWFATGVGVCRVRDKAVTLYTENDGLRSEIVYAVERSPRGEVLVASMGGMGRFHGRRWLFDFPAVRRSVRTLLALPNSVWVGTQRGLVQLRDKVAVRRLARGDGLCGDVVLDVYAPRFRAQLWVLTKSGISVVDGLGMPAGGPGHARRAK